MIFKNGGREAPSGSATESVHIIVSGLLILVTNAKSNATVKFFKRLFSSFCLFLFDLILYVQQTIFQLQRDGTSWVGPVLSLLKDTAQ